MTASLRYPSNEILPHGWHMLIKGDHPVMWLDAYDESVRIELMGGFAIPDYYAAPECVQIDRDGLTGLVPPWRHIDQKGATQDGVTNIDSLYDPIEVGLKVTCRGRDGKHVHKVVRDLYASIDAKKQSRLNFISIDTGEHWWAPIRWFQGGQRDPVVGAQQRRQPVSLRLRADDAFWRSYADTASFKFTYDSMVETFDFTDTGDLGANWPLHYYDGAGAGNISANGSAAVWSESGTGARAVVAGPYAGFDTDTDNQVIEVELGNLPELIYPVGAATDIWGRMNTDAGAWDGDGIRARIDVRNTGFFGLPQAWVKLSRFNNFVETKLFEQRIFLRPRRGEKFTLVCGMTGEARTFRVLRNGSPILSHKEVGTASALGATHRGVGFGMKAGAGSPTQLSPPWINRVAAGDNAAITQSGFLALTNIGDQDCYYDYTFIGPGTVRIWDGPGAAANQFIEFGPLTANQAALLRTDPRDRNVYDLATMPAGNPSQQEATIFEAALNGLLSFLTLTNTNPLLSVIQSIFGIFGGPSAPALPQGNYYALLKGRFSDASAIPAKSPGNPASPYHVKVEIVGGNADSKVIGSGVPLRRWPL